MKAPRITVAIPTYNQLGTIRRAVDSVLAQDVEGLEVAVYDDSTAEDYAEELRGYQSIPNFSYIKNPSNLGMTANYRQGICRARGEFFLNLDGDDYLTDSTFLRKGTNLLLENNDAVVVIGGQRICDESGLELAVQQQTTVSHEVMDGWIYFEKSISETAPVIPHLATIVRTASARAIDYYSADLINSDLHSVRRLFLVGDVILIDNIAGVWSYGPSNVSTSFSPFKHSRNIRSLVDPAEYALRLIGDDAERSRTLFAQLRRGILKYHNDVYAICLRSPRPIYNIRSYQREARDLEYFGRHGIGVDALRPNLRIVRNLLLRKLLGRRRYIQLAALRSRGPLGGFGR